MLRPSCVYSIHKPYVWSLLFAYWDDTQHHSRATGPLLICGTTDSTEVSWKIWVVMLTDRGVWGGMQAMCVRAPSESVFAQGRFITSLSAVWEICRLPFLGQMLHLSPAFPPSAAHNLYWVKSSVWLVGPDSPRRSTKQEDGQRAGNSEEAEELRMEGELIFQRCWFWPCSRTTWVTVTSSRVCKGIILYVFL